MIDRGKKNLIGVGISAVDYEAAVQKIEDAAREGCPMAISALAVHGVMTGHTDATHRARLNSLDLVVPDGQPVRWALNLLHRTKLPDRVYGPNLMLKVCDMAARLGYGIYLYGTTVEVLQQLEHSLIERFPDLKICGAEPSKFRHLSEEEKHEVVQRIRGSGALITFVGLGCPRQEVWAYEYRELLSMPVLAVGAAFDFHSGKVSQAPSWMQDRGLEWLFRLKTEPRRLWRRYVLLNPWYVGLVAAQYFRLRRFGQDTQYPEKNVSYG